MDMYNYTTERKKGQHLNKQGFSNRRIARELGCSPTTVGNELKRGTAARKSKRGRAPMYSAKLGEAVYRKNRKNSRRKHKIKNCPSFTSWTIRQVREHKWSFDACVGYAKKNGLFPKEEIVSTHTLYNEAWAGNLDFSIVELPDVLKRKRHKREKVRQNKRMYGKSISERPETVGKRVEAGHWEGDTVVGKRAGREEVVFTLLEKKTMYYIALRIPGKDSDAVMSAMEQLKEEFGDKFPDVFKTITVDNGSEFSTFANVEGWGTRVYFAHPYSSWERAQNERHNGMLRMYIPKGMSIRDCSDEYVLEAADEINARPRKRLGYSTPELEFDEFLDSVYALV